MGLANEQRRTEQLWRSRTPVQSGYILRWPGLSWRQAHQAF